MENTTDHSTSSVKTAVQSISPYSSYFFHDALRYPLIAVHVFGIIGNALVIISILKQRHLLKNNYYFLVSHLAACDLLWLLIILFNNVTQRFYEGSLFGSITYCIVDKISFAFQVAGLGMMLMISVLRYRATVHPLKPAISRQNLKIVCGLVYIAGFIFGYGPVVTSCFMHQRDSQMLFIKIHPIYIFSCFYLFPTVFMAKMYLKIGQTVIKQNKLINSLCSNSVRGSAPSSSFNLQTFIRNRRTFLVCLMTVLCFALGHVPASVWFMWFIFGQHHLMIKYRWFYDVAIILRISSSHSVNPLIYGILDKNMLKFWKLCRKKKREP